MESAAMATRRQPAPAGTGAARSPTQALGRRSQHLLHHRPDLHRPPTHTHSRSEPNDIIWTEA
eukprot:4675250-Pyramimonas_sp.AAC.1